MTVRADDVSAPPFHRAPPYSPRRLLGRPVVLAGTVLAVLTLAVLAAVDAGAVLLAVDRPVMEWVADQRTDAWGTFFLWAGCMGDNLFVFPAGAALAAVTWRRCRYLALALVVAVAVRPALEFVLKAVIDRSRPDIDPLVDFLGPSHPSGHPLAAVSVWGLLPPVVAVFGASRRVWWSVTGLVSAVVVLVAASRVYRGAHWPLDVVASILWGALFLLVVEVVYDHVHAHFGWAGGEPDVEDAEVHDIAA